MTGTEPRWTLGQSRSVVYDHGVAAFYFYPNTSASYAHNIVDRLNATESDTPKMSQPTETIEP